VALPSTLSSNTERYHVGSNVSAIVMDLPEAQKEFLALVNKITDVSISTRFHNWIKTNWLYESTSRRMKMNIFLLYIPNWFNLSR
jgi:hypothetical protein